MKTRKAYLIISGYDEDCEVDSVFLNKEEAKAYVAAGNQIAFNKCDLFRIEKVVLNPPIQKKWVVEVHGYINNDGDICDFEIERIDRSGTDQLKNFTGNNIDLYPGKIYDEESVVFFDGSIDVTSHEDECEEYIEKIISEKYERGEF